MNSQPRVHLVACCSQSNNCLDLGRYSTDYLCSLTDERKYWLLTNVFRPTSEFKFPIKKENGKARSFQHPWLKGYPWLAYSRIFDGGFCVNCVLFAKGRLPLGQLVTTPMTCFTRAKQTLQEHNVKATHRVAMEDSEACIGQMEDGHSSVEQQLQTQAFDVIQRNRAILRSILKAVRFCGRQDIALRGHRESKQQMRSLSSCAILGIFKHSFGLLWMLVIKFSGSTLQLQREMRTIILQLSKMI